MDPVFLSRLQFAAATMFHFLFVPLTLGLSILIAYMETKYAWSGDKNYLRMTKFWGKLFLINFALGVVTGITLEFQFGTNWSRYSEYVGDVFGSLLAIEASAAFFLESTFIGIWIFGWNKISAKAHAGVMWVVAIAGNFSAVWILIANGFMQHPVGYDIRNGRAELTDFMAVVTNKHGLLEIIHVVPASLLLGAFFVMGISAYHLLKKQHTEIFLKSFRIALVVGLVSSLTLGFTGDMHGVNVSKHQPAKLAAMESHWETRTQAPIVMFAIPDETQEKNKIEIGSIPGVLSFLGFHDFNAEVVGLRDIPKEDRPPVLPTFVGFRTMVGLGTLFILLMIYGWIRRNKLLESPNFLKIMLWSIPLPYIAMEMGWVVSEVGRQPWIVYNLMRTSDAVSPIAGTQVMVSLTAFILVYGLLGAVGFYLIAKSVKEGPEAVTA
ncbi:cytochrome ubiquinol oxidase subunit I [Desulfobacter hydrogenophilus]|uniref:Cytochrome ubiquinol oxidase subunit I n=1 Tax=Desulfobacter hydrogenophilus TaxID=2291 RepID=A0A328FA73_9BACT|nr:cytochrome ubiquinol oxidase subunit I [Desulfobacter hydrogenophilus]NDY73652.1 cytochrome ubiquinol oxidase subunit I [Desulfobacter hydrogenophilus]QBH14930.1 cytochrome ubiquinol oxidase subunit I [Desulfobacter hydrogenophilus]RAM00590.1 cytochrome ubiquinol oxidase subunit I [Desulfobacter hydrogenophilus]